jgi:hypothetical protein
MLLCPFFYENKMAGVRPGAWSAGILGKKSQNSILYHSSYPSLRPILRVVVIDRFSGHGGVSVKAFIAVSTW